MDLEPVISGLNLEALRPLDWLKVMNLRALSFQRRQMYGRAVELLQDVLDQQLDGDTIADEMSAIVLYQSYLGQSDEALTQDPIEATLRLTMAIQLLHSEASRQKSDILFHHLAHLYIECGEFQRALHIYQNELCVPPFLCRRYLAGWARLLNILGASTGRVTHSHRLDKCIGDLATIQSRFS